MEKDAARSLFMVAIFHDSQHCAAIYEIKFGGGGGGGCGGVGKTKIDGPMVKAFSCADENHYSLVDCDMVGSQICLAASCKLYTEDGRKIMSFDPLLFDTVTKELDQLPKPQAKKPYPKVMAVCGSFYVLSTDTLCSGFRIKSPSFERFDPFHRKWDSIVPEYRVPEKTSLAVVGYAVIDDIILISVENATHYGINEFHCYRIGSSMDKWQVVEKEDRRARYYAFVGKAEFVDDFVYTWVENCLLIAYHVTFSTGDDDDRTIKSLGAPVKIVDTDPLDDLLYELYTSSLVHLGNKVFCVARTERKRVPPEVQHVTIMTLKVSDSMDPVTVSAEVSADFYPLNTEDLGQADVQSLFLDSRRFKDWPEYFEGLNADTYLQPVNTDPPKLESVSECSQPARKRVVSSSFLGKRSDENDRPKCPNSQRESRFATSPWRVARNVTQAELVDSFLQRLGLEKYSTTFKDEEIDMAILGHMGNEDLKSIGLPKGPRMMILLALESEVRHSGVD